MRLILLAWILALVSCGSDEKPDSGYGANTPIPPTRTCAELCERLADCAVALCNEDTSSNRYEGLRSALKESCELNCTDAAVQSEISAEEWTCMFTDTCREFADYDACMVDASYTCE